MPGGSLGKSGTDSNGRSGTRSWANDGDVEISNSAQNTAFIDNLRSEPIHESPFILALDRQAESNFLLRLSCPALLEAVRVEDASDRLRGPH